MNDQMSLARTSSFMSNSTPKRTSTKETTNYARLCCLLIDIGSQALRDTFDKIHPPGSLHVVLETNKTTLQKLRSRRILNATQWSKLYPAIAASVSSANFDITLILVLIRNICGLGPPATTRSWDVLPPSTDLSCEADIVRLKCFRNDIYAHAEKASFSELQFTTHWQDIRETLVRFGGKSYEDAINNLETESIDPEMEEHYRKVLEEWKKDEDNIKDMLNEIKNEVGNVSKKVDDLAAAIIPNKGTETIKIVIEVDSVTFKDKQKQDPTHLEEVKRKLMHEMTKTFFETRADKLAVKDIPNQLRNYLEGILDLPVVTAQEGSLILTVECRTLEILERLWEEYCSGHLNAVAEEYLVTDDLPDRFEVEVVKLKTTISKDDYLACKLSLMDLAEGDNATLVQKEVLVQEGETHLVREEFLEATETSDISVEEQPYTPQPLELAHDKGQSENSLRIAVKCPDLESLEHLWQDYCSGHLNCVAEELLVTDDIKRKFNLESIKLKTTISEEDYLAYKQYLLNRPDAVAGNHHQLDCSNTTSLTSSHAPAIGNLQEDKGAINLHSTEELMQHDPLNVHPLNAHADGDGEDCPEQCGASTNFGNNTEQTQQKVRHEPEQLTKVQQKSRDINSTDKRIAAKEATSGQQLMNSLEVFNPETIGNQGGKKQDEEKKN